LGLIYIFLIETLSWLFILLIEKDTLKYLLVQRYLLAIRLISLIYCPRVLMLVFLIKLGLPPFYQWVVALVSKMRRLTYLVFTTLHKLLPLLFISWTVLNFRVLSLTILWRGLFLLQMRSLLFIILGSSLINTTWIILSLLIKPVFIIMYWGLYTILTILLLTRLRRGVLALRSRHQRVLTRFVWLVVSGLPPFLIFWLKLNLVCFLLKLRFLIGILILMSRVLRIVAYFRVFQVNLVYTRIQTSIFFYPRRAIGLIIYLELGQGCYPTNKVLRT
jgi:hypothetical protein